MRDYDEYDTDANGVPYVVVQQPETGSGVGLFLLGLAIGAGAALLWAPQSGSDTRRIIRDRARTASDTAKRKAEEMAETVSSGIDTVKERFNEHVEVAKSKVREQRDEIADAFEAGRSAAHIARVELERKLAEQRQARREGHEEKVV